MVTAPHGGITPAHRGRSTVGTSSTSAAPAALLSVLGEEGAKPPRGAEISRQAIHRVPKPRPLAAGPAGPPADEVDAAIVEVAEANQTDG